MHKLSSLLLFFAMALSACQSDSPQDANEGGEGITPTPIEKPTQSAAPTLEQTSEQTQRLRNALTSNYWYIEGWVQMNNPDASLSNRGRWYQFNEDGTFTSGKYKKTSGKGTWSYSPSLARIHLESENFNETAEFTIKMATNNQVMIWVGTERYEQTGTQCKLENYLALMEELPQPSN